MYTQRYDTAGKFIGVTNARGGAVPVDPANEDWLEFLEWNKRGGLDTSDLPPPEQPAPVKERADLLAIVAKAPEALLAELWADHAKRDPDAAQAMLVRLGMADTVLEGR